MSGGRLGDVRVGEGVVLHRGSSVSGYSSRLGCHAASISESTNVTGDSPESLGVAVLPGSRQQLDTTAVDDQFATELIDDCLVRDDSAVDERLCALLSVAKQNYRREP